VSYRSHSVVADPLESVTAPARNDAWAVGLASLRNGSTRPVILHWNGSAWGTVTIPGTAGFRPDLVASSSPDNVWITGETGVIQQEVLVWNGHKWTTMSLPQGFGGPVTVLSSSDAWGDGEGQCSSTGSCSTTVWHWNGAVWTPDQIPGLVEDISGAGGHAWILALTLLRDIGSGDPTGRPAIYRSAGSTLRQVTAPNIRLFDFEKLAASPGGQLWMRAEPATDRNRGLLFHWDGRRWTDAAIPATVSGNVLLVGDPLIYDAHSGVWSGAWAHWTGTRWINTFQVAALPGADGFSLGDLAMIPGSASVWAAGWTFRTPTSSTRQSLIAVWGPVP
jgi:hypothetical protein